MKLHATSNDLLIKESERLISGSVKIYTCEFTFDESWDGYAVTAVFSTNGSRLVNMAVVDGMCEIPHEVLRPNAKVRIGVFGTDGERRKPTTYSEWITVEQGVDASGETAQPPTPSVYDQWMESFDEKFEEWNANEQARQEAEAERAKAEMDREDLETGYVAQARDWAGVAESWAKTAKEVSGGDFATSSEIEAEMAKHELDETAHANIRKDIADLAETVDTKGEDLLYDDATNRLHMTLDGEKLGAGAELPTIRGEKGDRGDAGKDGKDAVSPTIEVSKVGKVTTLTITDAEGTKTATINDGEDGKDGKDGEDAGGGSASEEVLIDEIDFTRWEYGAFDVTYADGKVKGGSVEFGSDGRPSSIRFNQHTLTLVWPEVE